VRAGVRRLHALQLDSVSTLVRAHYLPVFSRIGPYPTSVLDRMLNDTHEIVETQAHQASLAPVELEPLFRWRVEDGRTWWAASRQRLEIERPGYVEQIEQEVRDRGPLTISDLADPVRDRSAPSRARRKDGTEYAASSLLWSRGSNEGKLVLDGLVAEGRLARAGRRGFDRLYDLRERVIPADIDAQPAPPAAELGRRLVLLAAQALGVATVKDLADYFCTGVASATAAVKTLVQDGVLTPARVEGWSDPAFAIAGARQPRPVDARALLGPFDSLTWSRPRTNRLFNFEYSFEIYTPAAKRRYGYYVLPFLFGDTLAGRVDLKAQRKDGVLSVLASFVEPGHDPDEIAAAVDALIAGATR